MYVIKVKRDLDNEAAHFISSQIMFPVIVNFKFRVLAS